MTCVLPLLLSKRSGRSNPPLPPTPHPPPPSYRQILPEYLKDAGYESHMVGKWHLGSYRTRYTPHRRGFETFLGYLNDKEMYWTHQVCSFIGGGRGGGGKGNILVAVHGRNRIYRRPSHPLKPGTERVGLARWVFHIPSRHCLHHARIPVACSPSLAKGGLRSTGARAARDAFLLFGIQCTNFRLSVAASGGFILGTGVATSRCSIENIVGA